MLGSFAGLSGWDSRTGSSSELSASSKDECLTKNASKVDIRAPPGLALPSVSLVDPVEAAKDASSAKESAWDTGLS